jgi:hypothetical protein
MESDLDREGVVCGRDGAKRKKEQDNAESKATTFQEANQHEARARSSLCSGSGQVPELP